MEDIAITEQLVAVWKSMAEHFLDTENREGIPQTALLCVHAGLTIEEAHAVWLREVSPVVGANLLSVAGEWAGWDEEWLVTEVRARALRRRAQRRGKPLSKLLSRFRLDLNRGVWRSIERCMRLLEAAPPEGRDPLAQDLSLLAYHYFYFDSGVPSTIKADDARIERLRSLCATVFDALEPATLGDERAAARERVTRALAESTGA
jgi:hypothetical protein